MNNPYFEQHLDLYQWWTLDHWRSYMLKRETTSTILFMKGLQSYIPLTLGTLIFMC